MREVSADSRRRLRFSGSKREILFRRILTRLWNNAALPPIGRTYFPPGKQPAAPASGRRNNLKNGLDAAFSAGASSLIEAYVSQTQMNLGPATFATTHWSVVLAAGVGESPEATAALEQICRAYWQPLYAHARRRGHVLEEAQDLTQEFFARLLDRHWLHRADARRGRFRSFLLGAFDHFLANEWDRASCEKRGGGQAHFPLDALAAERLYLLTPGQGLNPAELYERDWALRFLERVRARLRDEYASAGPAGRFESLERFLPGEECPLSYAEAASQLGMAEGTLKSDVHRLKRRYGQLLREKIAQTVARPEEIDDELRHLMALLSR